jgi:hypothetical protein
VGVKSGPRSSITYFENFISPLIRFFVLLMNHGMEHRDIPENESTLKVSQTEGTVQEINCLLGLE